MEFDYWFQIFYHVCGVFSLEFMFLRCKRYGEDIIELTSLAWLIFDSILGVRLVW